jgi:hypothetical protein
MLLIFLHHFTAHALPYGGRFRHGPQCFAKISATRNKRTQHFPLWIREDELQKTVEFVVPVHSVFLLLMLGFFIYHHKTKTDGVIQILVVGLSFVWSSTPNPPASEVPSCHAQTGSADSCVAPNMWSVVLHNCATEKRRATRNFRVYSSVVVTLYVVNHTSRCWYVDTVYT